MNAEFDIHHFALGTFRSLAELVGRLQAERAVAAFLTGTTSDGNAESARQIACQFLLHMLPQAVSEFTFVVVTLQTLARLLLRPRGLMISCLAPRVALQTP